MIKESLALLGMNMTDRVTGFTGMVSSVTFDAYGCVQALLTPRMQDGKMPEREWFDVKRLELGKRIMATPSFGLTPESIPGGNNLPMPAKVSAPHG